MTGGEHGPAGFGAYATLLRTPEIARLLTGSILGRMQLGMASLAILLLVHARSGSFAAAGVAVGVFGATGALLTPFQGRLVDRLGQVHILAVCGAGQTVAFLVLAVAARNGGSTSLLIALSALAGGLLPPLSSCMRVLWGELVPAQSLEAAYSLDAISQEAIWTVGPLVVALFVTVSSAASAVAACGILTACGITLFATSPAVRRRHVPLSSRSWAGPLASGRIRLLLACIATLSIGTGVVQVAIPAIAVRAGSPGTAGVLLGVWSIGSAVGGLAYGAIRWRSPLGTRYAVLYGAIALATAPLLWTRSTGTAAVASLVAGLPLAPLLAGQYALVAEAAPAGTLTEAFSWNTAAAFGCLAAGNALGGWLINQAGLGGAFEAAIACAALAALAAIPILGVGRGAATGSTY